MEQIFLEAGMMGKSSRRLKTCPQWPSRISIREHDLHKTVQNDSSEQKKENGKRERKTLCESDKKIICIISRMDDNTIVTLC